MTWLRIYHDSDPDRVAWEGRDAVAIQSKLNAVGVRFEQWQARAVLPAHASDEQVSNAYRSDINGLMQQKGYQSFDVLRVLPDNPKAVELRKKFLSEHTHSEDEVRFFVEGAGMFYMHIGSQVFVTLCERGDLIGVPDGVPHWFDTGATPYFTVIRFFTNPEGWVARYTGDAIATRYPTYEGAPSSGRAA